MFKRYLLTAAIAAVLTACGGGGSSGGSTPSDSGGTPTTTPPPPPPSNNAITIEGTASAPGGAVALLKQQSLFEVAMNMLIPPATAAVIGLQPVTGATVELIRIDNDGNQVGDVLATTQTSITGDYRLTLPTGVDLSGDLIVRITGNGVSMRAQVVDQAVNISPVSEFVLRKFIASGTNLSTISEGDVVKLSGKVDEFDLTADGTNSIAEMLARLEAEVGSFVDNQIDAITSIEGDANGLDGSYRSSAFSLALHDSDGKGSGAFATDLYHSDFEFDGNSDGSVAIQYLGEEAAWGSLWGADPGANLSLHYQVDIDDEEETMQGVFDSGNVLTIESNFEEEIDGDWGWRWVPATFRLQKVRDRNTFFLIGSEGGARYATVDTNGDGTKDAIDPDKRDGDEPTRSIEAFFKGATDLTSADLVGTFGRVYLSTYLQASGTIEIESEVNELTFHGDDTIDASAAPRRTLLRGTSGASSYAESTAAAEADIAITTLANGIDTNGNSQTDGFVNDTADFIAFTESDGNNQTEARASVTWAVKLPAAAPTVTGKTYRLMYLNTTLDGQAIAVGASRFRSTVTWSSETAGTANLETGAIHKAGLQGEVLPMSNSAAGVPVSIQIAANGHTVIEYVEADGDTQHLDGYLNASGSYGIFQTSVAPEGDDINTLGIAVLVEVPSAE